jgi:CubicO group peptidase (beta-lactamase class C family)
MSGRSSRANTCSTRLIRSASPVLSGRAGPAPRWGYGYQFWLFPFRERTFAMLGVYGQVILVQPSTGIVMVQTAVDEAPDGRQDSGPSLERTAFWRGVLQSLGGSAD